MVLPDTNADDYLNNVSAASKVFNEYGDFIRKVIYYQLKDKAQVDDLFQDFFLSLVYRPVPGSIKNVKSYLYRAITNDIIDSTRRVERYRSHINNYAHYLSFSINNDLPENAVISIEQTDKMFELIRGRLPNSEARAVTLRYRNDCNIKEIAKKMGVNDRTISRYVSVGLSKIDQAIFFL